MKIKGIVSTLAFAGALALSSCSTGVSKKPDAYLTIPKIVGAVFLNPGEICFQYDTRGPYDKKEPSGRASEMICMDFIEEPNGTYFTRPTSRWFDKNNDGIFTGDEREVIIYPENLERKV